MDDFESDRSPYAVDRELRRVGINPDTAVQRALVDPDRVKRSDWNALGGDEAKVESIASDWSNDVPPVLLAETYGGFEVIDGLHRTLAAQRLGKKLPALIISEYTYDQIYNFGDSVMYEWAHSHN